MPEMETFSLDTHAMVKDLIAAGFTEQQAEAHVTTLSRFVTYNLATKTDIAAIHKDIEQLRKETKTDIEQLRQETKTNIELLRRDLTIRMGAIMVAGIGVVLAFLSLILTKLPG